MSKRVTLAEKMAEMYWRGMSSGSTGLVFYLNRRAIQVFDETFLAGRIGKPSASSARFDRGGRSFRGIPVELRSEQRGHIALATRTNDLKWTQADPEFSAWMDRFLERALLRP